MPVEDQWRRLHTPLGRRDRRVLGAVAVVAAAAIGGGAYYATSRPGESNAGCVVVTLPASLGGERLRRCGSDAAAFCRAEGKRNETIAAACHRKGFAVSG